MRLVQLFENDDDHAQEMERTGFWGKAGAGCIMLARDTGRILLPHRSWAVEQPDTWGTWGGAIDAGLSPEQAVRLEVSQEAGYHGHYDLIPLYVFKHPSGFRYFNYLAIVEEEFEPVLNWETQDHAWVEYGHWPAPLHFGLQGLLKNPLSRKIIQAAVEEIKQALRG
jgi:8-oxo-dGTP pyrophosphatase MutT (NUDIX family)